MSEIEVLATENGLLMAFSEVYDECRAWYPKYEILKTAGCQETPQEVVEEVRKRLGIESVEINGLDYWRWSSGERASDVWEEVSGRL